MRILFAITKGEIGGAQEHLRILARGLVERAHQVHLLVQTPSALAERAAPGGVVIEPWRSVVRNPDPLRDLAARRELAQAVDRLRPDVLHLYSAKAGVLGRGLLRPPRGVTVYTCHHPAFGPGRQLSHRLVARPVEQLSLPFVDGVVTDGARDVPLLRKLAPRVPVRVIRNAVPPPPRPLSPSTPVRRALWVARLRRPKDPLGALAAWERVVARLPDAELTMCGSGPLERELHARLERSPARHAVTLAGEVPDLDPFFAEASVYLLATRVEGGTTMATLEAMAHGLVPVISDAGDAFLLEHARCGLVVPVGSPRTMAAVLVALFEDPERLAAMRERALAFARTDWTVDQFVDATQAFYAELLGR